MFRSGRQGPLLPGSEHVAPFGCYRCAYGHPVDAQGQPKLDQCRLACASMVRYVLEREGDVAAIYFKGKGLKKLNVAFAPIKKL